MEDSGKVDQGEWLPVEHFCLVEVQHIALFKCSICSQFSTKLESMKNFKPAFTDGSSNILISAVKDHVATDMHVYAMYLLKNQQSSSVVDHAPIAKCFAEASMNQST